MISTITRHSLTVSVPEEYGEKPSFGTSVDSGRHQSSSFYCSPAPVVFTGGSRRRSKACSAEACLPAVIPATRPQSASATFSRPSTRYCDSTSSTAHRRRSMSFDDVDDAATYRNVAKRTTPVWRSPSTSPPSSASLTPYFRRPLSAAVWNDIESDGNDAHGSVDFLSLSAAVSWIEQMLRRCVVKFRSRQRRLWRSPSSSQTKAFQFPTATPEVVEARQVTSSRARCRRSTLEKQMIVQYAVYQSVQLPVLERLFALFYCWYFNRIDYIDGLLAAAVNKISTWSKRRTRWSSSWFSFRLAVAVCLTTALVFIGAVALWVSLKALLVGLTFIIHSALNFAFLLVGLFLFTIATVTFSSFK